MSKRNTVRVSIDQLKPGGSDWARVDAMTDEDIERAIADDPDAAPIADAEWFREAAVSKPAWKVATSLRVDADVMDWFRGQGRGWQTRMNAVLRAYAKAHGGVK
jgi:uncharacterized protein (DUF4415 family)